MAAKFRFGSFDRFSEAMAGWDLDWRQLDRGRLDARMFQARSTNMLVTRVAFNRRFLQRGGPPPGMLTFALPDVTAGEVEWCGRRGDHRNLFVFNPESGYDSITQPGFSVTTLSISRSRLEDVASQLELSLNLSELQNTSAVLEIDPRAATRLRNTAQLLEMAFDDSRSDFYRPLLDEVSFRLASLLVSDSRRPVRFMASSRISAARHACNYIETHADQAPSIDDISLAAGVSRRTLNYAFREHFGVTPKQYLQATRLDGVRRELLRHGSAASISDFANRWGFWHMGQFAADYKRHFGELPSETARKNTST